MKEFFSKPFRNKTDIAHAPKRQLDPYEENEVKGTRMPDYSGLARERDVYGELGWIPNFNVKLSKNNNHRHDNYREYFDAPRDYNVAFTNATVTNTEFFRENAPDGSVAKGDGSKMLLN